MGLFISSRLLKLLGSSLFPGTLPVDLLDLLTTHESAPDSEEFQISESAQRGRASFPASSLKS